MRTTVNRFFLLSLIACVALMAAAVHGLHAFQVSRQSRFLLDEAHQAQKEQQFELALNRFQMYTKLAPQDVDAQAEYGLLLADLHAPQVAAFMLEKVLRSQPDRNDVRRRVVDVEMEIGRWRDAHDHLIEHLLKKAPEDGSLWDLLGMCQAGLGNFGEAQKSFLTSIKQTPKQIDPYLHLAQIQRHRLDPPQPQDADKNMKLLVRNNPESARAHALYGQYLESLDQKKPAGEQAEATLKLDPKNVEGLLLAESLSYDNAQYDQARGFAERVKDAAPTLAAGYSALARIEQQSGNPKKAIACLEAGVEKTAPRNASLLWELGRAELGAGELAKAQDVAERLRKLPADEHFAPLIDYLEAQLEFANHRWQKAVERYEQVLPELRNAPELLKEVQLGLAICHQQLGNTEQQLIAYREAARIDPTWPPARLGVAATLLSLGKLDEALEEYRQMSQMKTEGMSGDGALGMARILITKNLTATPAQRNWPEVEPILSQLSKQNPELTVVTLLEADAKLGQGQAAEAESILEAARNKTPDKIELWTALLALEDQQKDSDKAARISDEASKKFGDQAWLRLAKASSLVVRYGPQAAPKLKPLIDSSNSFSTDDLLRLYRGAAILSLQAGDREQAKNYAQRACQADPKNLEIRELLFDIALLSSDAKGLEQALHEIRGLEGEGPFWHYGQAALCLLREPATPALAESAFQHLAAARKLRPGWAKVPLLTAQIQDRQQQSAAALKNYLEAIDLGECSPGAVRRTIELLNAQHRYAEADQVLRRLEQQPLTLSNEIERLASEASARVENLDRAVEIATKVATSSRDWHDYIWLGELQSLLGRRALTTAHPEDAKPHLVEAEEALKTAVRLKRDVGETWVALVGFYAATHRKADAETAILRAKDYLPKEIASLALAACYEAVGNMEEASKQYESALAGHGQDPLVLRRVAEYYVRYRKYAEAEPKLRAIMSSGAAKPEDLTWARRELATVLRASVSYPKIQEALTLVEQNLAAGPSPADLREKAFALAACPQLERRREAIRILEQLPPAETDSPEVKVILAQLYLSQKDWLKGAEQLRTLATSQDREPHYLALYIDQLLQHQETAEAELWLDRLEKLAPGDFSALALRAQALVQRGEIAKAVQTLRGYRDQKVAEPAAGTARLGQVAALLESLTRGSAGTDGKTGSGELLAEAEASYREFVKQQPKETLVLASFLARRGRFDEALDLMERAIGSATADTFAKTAGDLVAGGVDKSGQQQQLKPEQQQRLDKLLLAAADEHDRPISILLALGELRGTQDRVDEAVQVYREILKRDENNLGAMNNLAVLLALQKRDLSEAQRLVEKVIEIAGPLPALLDSRASVYLALGKPQEALSDLQQVAGEDPRPNRQFHLALAYFRAGQEKAAAQALAEGRKLGLTPDKLHPLERPDYRDLTAKLGRFFPSS